MRKITIKIILTAFTFLWGFTATSFSQNNDCKTFRTGKYKLVDEKINKEFLMVRNDSIQIESDLTTGQTTKFKINWESDCKYNLIIVDGQQAIMDFYKDKKLNIEIIETFKDGYKFCAKLDGFDQVYYQTARKIE